LFYPGGDSIERKVVDVGLQYNALGHAIILVSCLVSIGTKPKSRILVLVYRPDGISIYSIVRDACQQKYAV
jgi:hypothetical protein